MSRIKFRLPSPAMVVALVALSVAMGGTGYAANDLVHSAAKQHKKPKPTKPLTRAQILALIKQNTPKAINGVNGKDGAPGGPGTAVLTRVRSTAAATSATATTSVVNGCTMNCPDSSRGNAVSLTAQTWTQAANQIDQLLGQVTITPPVSSSCTANTLGSSALPGSMIGEVDDATNGMTLLTFGAFAVSANPTAVTTSLSNTPLFEAAGPVGHTLVVKIADNCGAGSGATGGGHFTLNAFALDPVGVS